MPQKSGGNEVISGVLSQEAEDGTQEQETSDAKFRIAASECHRRAAVKNRTNSSPKRSFKLM
ncbi:hypothetical protein EAI_04663 [Harpegnathos saltator]|uniref:Uncharacterized protein n=1 Tax=Harpegnathos saltator TaxID=610380 RepID=E2BTR8_HARSA|nr:hypothetical protein EAI_04663 [Harpegnathos saltator]